MISEEFLQITIELGINPYRTEKDLVLTWENFHTNTEICAENLRSNSVFIIFFPLFPNSKSIFISQPLMAVSVSVSAGVG